MDDSTYYLKCQRLERQLETVTRALRDTQDALDTERAMRKLERQQQRLDELFEEKGAVDA